MQQLQPGLPHGSGDRRAYDGGKSETMGVQLRFRDAWPRVDAGEDSPLPGREGPDRVDAGPDGGGEGFKHGALDRGMLCLRRRQVAPSDQGCPAACTLAERRLWRQELPVRRPAEDGLVRSECALYRGIRKGATAVPRQGPAGEAGEAKRRAGRVPAARERRVVGFPAVTAPRSRRPRRGPAPSRRKRRPSRARRRRPRPLRAGRGVQRARCRRAGLRPLRCHG